jgi:hypothetical protein
MLEAPREELLVWHCTLVWHNQCIHSRRSGILIACFAEMNGDSELRVSVIIGKNSYILALPGCIWTEDMYHVIR